jgi:uncharacterized membrane protein YhaH (DUF805 family)
MFKNPFSFNGRIRRTEFGISFIITAFINAIIGTSIQSAGTDSVVALFYIPMIWFILAQGAKREHDLGLSGWWQLIPFRFFWLIFTKGQNQNNKFGTNPIM